MIRSSRFPEMYNLLLTICLLYIFIEEFSQVDVFLREKIEQVTLVCIKDPFEQLFFEADWVIFILLTCSSSVIIVCSCELRYPKLGL